MDEGTSAAPATLPDSGVTAEAAFAAAGPSEGRRGLAAEESPMRDVDLMSTEWTDEKHNLYLNSIEASFISQLYSSEYSSDDFHGLSPITKKGNNAPASDINNRSTGQFKVQRDGSWGKINFERATNHVENKAWLLNANPWIRHFRSPLIGEREVKSSEQNGRMDTAIMESGHQKHKEEFASSKHPINTFSHMFYQASDESTAEVMDQNFVDMNSKEQLNGLKKRRRTRTKAGSATKDCFSGNCNREANHCRKC